MTCSRCSPLSSFASCRQYTSAACLCPLKRLSFWWGSSSALVEYVLAWPSTSGLFSALMFLHPEIQTSITHSLLSSLIQSAPSAILNSNTFLQTSVSELKNQHCNTPHRKLVNLHDDSQFRFSTHKVYDKPQKYNQN